jgi:hypothetical protein
MKQLLLNGYTIAFFNANVVNSKICDWLNNNLYDLQNLDLNEIGSCTVNIVGDVLYINGGEDYKVIYIVDITPIF